MIRLAIINIYPNAVVCSTKGNLVVFSLNGENVVSFTFIYGMRVDTAQFGTPSIVPPDHKEALILRLETFLRAALGCVLL